MSELDKTLDAFALLRSCSIEEIEARLARVEEEHMVLKTLLAMRRIVARDEDEPLLATDLDKADKDKEALDEAQLKITSYIRQYGAQTYKAIKEHTGLDGSVLTKLLNRTSVFYKNERGQHDLALKLSPKR